MRLGPHIDALFRFPLGSIAGSIEVCNRTSVYMKLYDHEILESIRIKERTDWETADLYTTLRREREGWATLIHIWATVHGDPSRCDFCGE